MPDPTDKRAALESLGGAIDAVLPYAPVSLRQVLVDSIERYADARLADYLRAPEAEGGCIKSPFVSRMCERGTRGCDVRHDAPSEDGDSPEHTAFCRSYELRRIRGGKLHDLNVDWRGLESLREGHTVRLVAKDTREELIVRVAGLGEEKAYPDGSTHYAATRIIQVALVYELKDNDAPSEEDDGPEVWVEIDRHGKPAQVNDHKPGYGWEHDPKGRAVRYVPAAAAERRIAELGAERDTLAEQMRDATEHIIGLDDALAKADRERAAAVKRAEEAEAKLSDATAALKKAGEAIDILRKGPLVLR